MKFDRRAFLSALAGTCAGAAILASGSPAHAYKSTSRTQPGFATSKLAMTVKGKPRVRALVTLKVTGFNELFPMPPDPDFPDRMPLDYSLDVYVQDRAVYSTCAPYNNEQNDRIINLPTKVKNIGFLNVGPSGPFRKSVKFRAGSARKIMFCSYIRYSAADDIIMSSLKHNLAKKRRPR